MLETAQIALVSEADDQLTLHVAVAPDAPVLLVVGLASDPSVFITIPAVADGSGAIALSGSVDLEAIPPEIASTGFEVLVATLDPADGALLVSDPITLPIPAPPEDPTTSDTPSTGEPGSKDDDGGRSPSPGSSNDDQAMSSPSGPNPGLLPPTLQTSATVSTLGGLVPSPIVFRRSPNHRFVVSHDQPVPIQGSGH